MSRQCHSKLDDESVLKSFRNLLTEDPSQFRKWNTTSLGHLYLTGVGCNGEEGKALALQVLDRFISWTKTEPDYGKKLYPGQMELMPPVADLQKLRQEIVTEQKNIKDRGLTQEQIRHHLFAGIDSPGPTNDHMTYTPKDTRSCSII